MQNPYAKLILAMKTSSVDRSNNIKTGRKWVSIMMAHQLSLHRVIDVRMKKER